MFRKKAKVSFIRKSKELKQNGEGADRHTRVHTHLRFIFKNTTILEKLVICKTSCKIHRFQLFRLQLV